MEIFGRGKLWAWANKLQSVHAYAKYIFGTSVNIAEENFGEWLTIHQFFLCQTFPMYGIKLLLCSYYYQHETLQMPQTLEQSASIGFKKGVMIS